MGVIFVRGEGPLGVFCGRREGDEGRVLRARRSDGVRVLEGVWWVRYGSPCGQFFGRGGGGIFA